MHDPLGNPSRLMMTQWITSLCVGVYQSPGNSPTHSVGQCIPLNGFLHFGDEHTTAENQLGLWAQRPQPGAPVYAGNRRSRGKELDMTHPPAVTDSTPMLTVSGAEWCS
jgi:hypothetical protein